MDILGDVLSEFLLDFPLFLAFLTIPHVLHTLLKVYGAARQYPKSFLGGLVIKTDKLLISISSRAYIIRALKIIGLLIIAFILLIPVYEISKFVSRIPLLYSLATVVFIALDIYAFTIFHKKGNKVGRLVTACLSIIIILCTAFVLYNFSGIQTEATDSSEVIDFLSEAGSSSETSTSSEKETISSTSASSSESQSPADPEVAKVENQRMNGLVYTGEVKLSTMIPHGYGKAVYDNGDIYEGNWENGVKSGVATYIWADNDNDEENNRRFEGTFKGNTHTDGTYYNWQDGNGNIGNYTGSLQNGVFEGFGSFEYLDDEHKGDRFEGTYKEGKGWDGIYTFQSGYTAEVKEGKLVE
jgi:hypothetical protein